MYNPKYTKDYHETSTMHKKYLIVKDTENNILCGISKKTICDLNGKKIATFVSKEKKDQNSEVKIYQGELGKFKVIGDCLFLDDNLVGTIQEKAKKENKAPLWLLFLTCLLLVVVIAIVALIDVNNNNANKPDTIPTFEIKDTNGSWEEQGTIAIFDETIKPGSNGAYDFIISNSTNTKLRYTFNIEEHYESKDENLTLSFEYRLKMNNKYITASRDSEEAEAKPGETWLAAKELKYQNIEVLAKTVHLLTLEWQWPFNGDDSNDTLLGKNPGKYYLTLNLTAEIVETVEDE